jgi:hypothetical protein
MWRNKTVRDLIEMEVRKYQIEISNSFAASENLNDSKDVNMAWENINLYKPCVLYMGRA